MNQTAHAIAHRAVGSADDPVLVVMLTGWIDAGGAARAAAEAIEEDTAASPIAEFDDELTTRPVSHTVDGADNVALNGTYLTKVFEGPFKDAGKWHKQLVDYVNEHRKTVKNTYFFYTTCPNCAKHYGKNYVIGLAQIA